MKDYGLSKQEIDKALEAAAYRKRIREWIRVFQEKGYTDRQRKWDEDAAIATAMIMAVEGEKPHLQGIIRTSMERIVAGQIFHNKSHSASGGEQH